MQLTKFTDYGLRLLIYLLQPSDGLRTITQAACVLQVSENHLVKVTHFMVKQGWLISTRGKGGGIRLAPQALSLPLGEMVRCLEHDQQIVNCSQPACALRVNCGLNGILDQALEQFYQHLNQYQLQDARQQPLLYDLNQGSDLQSNPRTAIILPSK
jgi:Rrf2 family nitric oxide-sensitive transcriptional repressor